MRPSRSEFLTLRGRRYHVRTRSRLGHGNFAVELERAVIVHVTASVQNAAVTMVGVLVEAEVVHDDDVVTETRGEGPSGNLTNPLVGPRLRTSCIFGSGHAKQDDAGDAEGN